MGDEDVANGGAGPIGAKVEMVIHNFTSSRALYSKRESLYASGETNAKVQQER